MASRLISQIAGALGASKPDLSNSNRIRTPHAAIIIWNYDDRLGYVEKARINKVNSTIISTASCVSISTNKTKSDPQGNFQIQLAPTQNWVATITPGSWCAILMSNQPLTADDFKNVDPNKLKMVGKIDTVRVGTEVDNEGAQITNYYVSGVDWGYMFHNMVYIDTNLTADASTRQLTEGTAVAILNLLFGESGQPQRISTTGNILALLDIFGKEFSFNSIGRELNLVASAIYTLALPEEMAKFLGIKNIFGQTVSELNSAIKLISGSLRSSEDTYKEEDESYGFIDPFSMQGTNTFWQLLLDNCNICINEMFTEMRPTATGMEFALYKRIKPFIVRHTQPAIELSLLYPKVVSYFQNIKTHLLDPYTVIDINAGTNWGDKYNFAEIKPNWQELSALEATIKPVTQTFDAASFTREGFRPLIFSTRHAPSTVYIDPSLGKGSWQDIKWWVRALRAWHFDTHKMLNGTITLTGVDGYIGVGDNIKFDAALINANNNFNLSQKSDIGANYILAHVENISHKFAVSQNGARTFSTQIQFVRGIVVDDAGYPVGDLFLAAGAVDEINSTKIPGQDINSLNVKDFSSEEDPQR
jgi:hypothetical protein